MKPGYLLDMDLLQPFEYLIFKFVNVVEPIFQRCNLNIIESKTLSEIRDTLLPKLLSGEIDVGEMELLLEDIG